MAKLHDDWKTLKKSMGDWSKVLPSEKFGASLDSFEAAVAEFVKKCNEVDAAFTKMVAKRKEANDTLGVYDKSLVGLKDTNGKTFHSSPHGTNWIKFMSSLKGPMITAGTAFNNLRTNLNGPLKTMAGI